MKLLVASDLSARSELALQRALSLAEQLDAELSVLHVIDDDLPRTIQNLHKDNARDVLHESIKDSGKRPRSVKVLVRTGDPFRTVCNAADEMDADLIVMGAHRRDLLKDTFVGTTAERIMRLSRRPVLMVNQAPSAPYHNPLIAIDLSAMTPVVLEKAKSLGFDKAAGLGIVHAFIPFPMGQLTVMAPGEVVSPEQVEQCRQNALKELSSAVQAAGLSLQPDQLIAQDGEAFAVIQGAVQAKQADLLIMGTSGQGGMKRLLLGSVAGRLLRELRCDMLVIPAPN